MWHGGHERRRYSAVMPDAALASGNKVRQRRRRRDAMNDLARGLERYLRAQSVAGNRVEWTAWALRLAAGVNSGPAPDGSYWHIKVHIEFE